MPLVAVAAVVGGGRASCSRRARDRGAAGTRWARMRSAAAGDIRDGLLARRAWLGIAIASALVVGGHAVTFMIAARTAGGTAPPSQMLPLALLVMLAMVLPSIGGWGPREGVTAWVFAAAGLGADQGVATAVVYGVMVLVASLPGAVVLVLAWICRRSRPGAARSAALVAGSGRPSGPTECHMSDRPYTLLSCGMSIDGYLGSATPLRLTLSNEADFDRVDAVRASCDAILVGAGTVRIDNPRLLVRSQSRRDERAARGLAPSPIKVTVTERVELDACADFFTTGDAEKLVYCASSRVADARSRLGPVATVVDAGRPVEMRRISEDLGTRGVQRLMVEGGGKVHTQFLDRQPRRRAAAGRRAVLRRRLPGHAVRQRRPLPVEPRSARDARRGPADRRRGAAALRALAALPGRLSEEIDAAATAHRDDPHPGVAAPAVRRRLRHARPRVHASTASSTARSTSRSGWASAPAPSRSGERDRCRSSGRTASASPATCSAASAATAVRSCARRSSASPSHGGYLLYLRQEGRGIGLYAKLDAYALQDTGLDTYEANVALGHGEDERSYAVAAQMLQALGVSRVALLSNNPDKAAQLGRSA